MRVNYLRPALGWLALLAALIALAIPAAATAHNCTHFCDSVVHPYTGDPVWCGASVGWNRIWLPWGYWECQKVWHYGGTSHWEWNFLYT